MMINYITSSGFSTFINMSYIRLWFNNNSNIDIKLLFISSKI
jgi:hypothetical protein